MTAHACIVLAATLALLTTLPLAAQDRDVRGERLVIDDNGSDGTTNTMTITSPGTLGQNVILTIPDLGVDSLQFLLVPIGTSGAWFLTGNSGTTPGTNFLGTSDSTALHLYVNGGANNGLILNTNGSMQRNISGDARGVQAVDMQLSRDTATEVASGDYSTVGGGRSNTASGSTSTIGGGLGNLVSGTLSTVGGGHGNHALSTWATVAGGSLNTAEITGTTVGGGRGNTAGNAWSTVSGGYYNDIGGALCAIPGGRGLTLNGHGAFGFLGGNNQGLNVNDGGSFAMTISASNVAVFGNTDLWLANNDSSAREIRLYEANSSTGSFPSATNYSSFQAQTQGADIEYLLPSAAGTVGQQLTISAVAGTQVTLGWAAASDRAKKTDFMTLSGEHVLQKFRGIDLGTWRYDPAIDPKGTRHYGIMAQDFHAAFGNDGLGAIGTDTTVTDIDLHGVSFLAIQGLEERTRDQQTTIRTQAGRIGELETELQMLRAELAELRRMMQE